MKRTGWRWSCCSSPQSCWRWAGAWWRRGARSRSRRSRRSRRRRSRGGTGGHRRGARAIARTAARAAGVGLAAGGELRLREGAGAGRAAGPDAARRRPCAGRPGGRAHRPRRRQARLSRRRNRPTRPRRRSRSPSGSTATTRRWWTRASSRTPHSTLRRTPWPAPGQPPGGRGGGGPRAQGPGRHGAARADLRRGVAAARAARRARGRRWQRGRDRRPVPAGTGGHLERRRFGGRARRPGGGCRSRAARGRWRRRWCASTRARRRAAAACWPTWRIADTAGLRQGLFAQGTWRPAAPRRWRCRSRPCAPTSLRPTCRWWRTGRSRTGRCRRARAARPSRRAGWR